MLQIWLSTEPDLRFNITILVYSSKYDRTIGNLISLADSSYGILHSEQEEDGGWFFISNESENERYYIVDQDWWKFKVLN